MGLFIVREGEGEEGAMPSLVLRLRDHLGLEALPFIPRNGNWRKSLVTAAQVRESCEQIRGNGSCQALLLTRDADNDDLPHGDCPKYSAPEIAAWVRELALPFPAAVVLFYKEYETLFLAGAGAMAGKDVVDQRDRTVATIPDDVAPHPAPEHPRDAKGWVRANLVDGYKPTLFQTSLTRLLDFDVMEASALSSYRRLVRGLTFLSENLGTAGAVYPSPTGVG
jgi:hypothetical protein